MSLPALTASLDSLLLCLSDLAVTTFFIIFNLNFPCCRLIPLLLLSSTIAPRLPGSIANMKQGRKRELLLKVRDAKLTFDSHSLNTSPGILCGRKQTPLVSERFYNWLGLINQPPAHRALHLPVWRKCRSEEQSEGSQICGSPGTPLIAEWAKGNLFLTASSFLLLCSHPGPHLAIPLHAKGDPGSPACFGSWCSSAKASGIPVGTIWPTVFKYLTSCTQPTKETPKPKPLIYIIRMWIYYSHVKLSFFTCACESFPRLLPREGQAESWDIWSDKKCVGGEKWGV